MNHACGNNTASAEVDPPTAQIGNKISVNNNFKCLAKATVPHYLPAVMSFNTMRFIKQTCDMG